VKRIVYRADAAQRLPVGEAIARDEAGRVWCQLFPVGTWHRADFPGGKLELTQALAREFESNWRAEGAPALPVDRHHVEDGPAAGWIENLDASGRFGAGLWGAVKWTDRATAQIRADEYRFLSPTWAMSYASRTSGEKLGPWLYGAALLNDPYFNSMPRVAASDSPDTTHTQPAPKGNGEKMNKARICAALGLPEDTEDEKVMEALESRCKAALEVEVEEKDNESMPEGEKMAPAEKEAMKAAAAEGEKLRAALTASADVARKLTARVTELEGKLKASEDAAFERDISEVLRAPKAGLPAMADTLRATAKAMGLDVVRQLVAALPDIPTQEVGTSGKPVDTGDALSKYEALVDEKVKAGMRVMDAYRAVNLEHRELAERVQMTSPAKAN